jgi:hypothetical protein
MDKQRYEREKQKYEREIEEILSKYDMETDRKEKTERPGPRKPLDSGPRLPGGPFVPGRGYAPRRTWALPKNWKRFSSGQFIAAAFASAFLAVMVHNFSQLLADLLVLLAVVLFFLPIVLYRSTGTTTGGWSATEQKRWRGQVIDINTRRDITNDPLAAIKRLFKRR